MKDKAKRALPAGVIVPFPKGKVTKAKSRKPLSEKATLKIEAEELIVALADAAHDIGVAGVVNDYSKKRFPPLPEASHCAACLRSSIAGLVVGAARRKQGACSGPVAVEK